MVRGRDIFCSICGKKFYRENWQLKRNKKNYCSKKCSDIGKKRLIVKKCGECGKKFTTIPSKDYQFCSHKCSAINHGKNGFSKEHLRKLKVILKKNWENSKRCGKCGRLLGKDIHICPTKEELRKIGKKNLTNKEAQIKANKTRKRLFKEGKTKMGFQKGHKVPKEWIKKSREYMKKHHPKYWLGKKRNEKERKKMSKSHIGINTGEKNWNWKGGITPFIKARWSSIKYQKWRKAVFKKNNYTCQNCGIKSGDGEAVILNAHHIKSIYKYPKLIFRVDNGKTLCLKCHLNYHKKHGFK